MSNNQIEQLVEAINNADGHQKHTLRCMFLIDVKKINNDLTLLDCRKLLGFYSDDEEQDARLQISFRNDIFNPTRNFITKNIFNIGNDECNKIWERSAPDELKSKRQVVLDQLPQSKRNKKDKPNQLELSLAQTVQQRGYVLR